MATGVLVPDWRLAESRGTHFSVAQDTSLPAGAARALVQVPGLPLHVKLPAGRPAHHHVHPLWLTAAWLVYSGGGGGGKKGNSHVSAVLSTSHSGLCQTNIHSAHNNLCNATEWKSKQGHKLHEWGCTGDLHPLRRSLGQCRAVSTRVLTLV